MHTAIGPFTLDFLSKCFIEVEKKNMYKMKFAENPEAQKISQIVKISTIKLVGTLTPLVPILFRREIASSINFPENATHWRFASPGNGAKLAQVSEDALKIPELHFLLSGGFVFFDNRGEYLAASTLRIAPNFNKATSQQKYLKFSRGTELNPRDAKMLEDQARFYHTTWPYLKSQNRQYFGWASEEDKLNSVSEVGGFVTKQNGKYFFFSLLLDDQGNSITTVTSTNTAAAGIPVPSITLSPTLKQSPDIDFEKIEIEISQISALVDGNSINYDINGIGKKTQDLKDSLSFFAAVPEMKVYVETAQSLLDSNLSILAARIAEQQRISANKIFRQNFSQLSSKVKSQKTEIIKKKEEEEKKRKEQEEEMRKKKEQEEEMLRIELEKKSQLEKKEEVHEVAETFSITGLPPLVKCRKNAAFYIVYNGKCTSVTFAVIMEPSAHVKVDVQDKKDGTFLVIFHPKSSAFYSVRIKCFENGLLTAESSLAIEVERQDRWIITGLESRHVYPLHEPIKFTISEKPADDLSISQVGSNNFYVEVRDPMKNRFNITPKSHSLIPLEFEMEFHPEYNGVHKLALYYKSVLIGDIITIHAGIRRFGTTDYRFGICPPNQQPVLEQDFTITPVGNFVGVQILPTPTSTPTPSTPTPTPSTPTPQKKGWFW